MRKIIFRFSALFLSLLICEAASLGMLMVLKYRWNYAFHFDAKEFLGQLSTAEYEIHLKSFDPFLGWKEIPGIQRSEEFGHPYLVTIEKDGARKNPHKPKTTIAISTYGDSFTKGDGVNDDETFQYYLSKSSETCVKNFGVSGYGPDQAVLNYGSRFDDRSRFAILVIMSENIRRASNYFRKFYIPASSVFPGFKPMMLLENETMRLQPVPKIKESLDKEELYEQIKKAEKIDPWADIRVKTQPPYIFACLKFLFNRSAVENNKVALQRILNYPGWENPDSIKILEFWVSEFHRLAAERREVALVVFIPQGLEFSRPPYKKFQKDYMQKRLFVDFSEAAKSKTSADVYLHPQSGHLNPQGNQILAQMIFEKIKPFLN